MSSSLVSQSRSERCRALLIAVFVLLASLVLAARPVSAVTDHALVIGPNQACCWNLNHGWGLNSTHGYPNFQGQAYWTYSNGQSTDSYFQWSRAAEPTPFGDFHNVNVYVWVPNWDANATVTYVVIDGPRNQHLISVAQANFNGWVFLGTFDLTLNGSWGGITVTVSDRTQQCWHCAFVGASHLELDWSG